MRYDRGSREANEAQGGTALRLLLVEPDERNAVWIGEMLRAGWGHPVVVAHAERLVDAARELTPAATDCVVIDVPAGGHGHGPVLESLRRAAAQIPLIALLDTPDEELARAALRAGAQDVLVRGELQATSLRRALVHAIERKRVEAHLVHRALHDAVTGLPNRALFLDRLGVALDRARRSGALVAVLFLDVDNFKPINDTRGHAAGDRLLVELAERLGTMLRPMDTVARFGGDEFIFLFEGLADEHEVVLIAERIARACRVPIDLDHGEVTLTVSMGIAMVKDPRTPPETVIREADTAMYRAKAQGPGRYEVFDESTRERARARIELERALRHALIGHELRVHYQPKFSLQDASTVVGLEALVRWQHPDRGLIGAQEFIALAEETGLILDIGRYVVQEVLRPLADWRRRRPDMTIAVNVSLRELEDIGLVSSLAAALHHAGVDPAALCLEIAERAVTRSPAVVTRVLHGLKELGVHTAIDDFGTGASSVLSLRELPVDTIKLHQTLLSELAGEPPRAPVVGAVVDLAHALGLRVVAEGVETEEQAGRLRALGCDSAQGYLFGPAVPEDEVEPLLAQADGSFSLP